MAVFQSWLNNALSRFRPNSLPNSTSSASSPPRSASNNSRLQFDTATILAAVRDKHGVNIDPDDPAFLLVTINELVLQSVLEEIIARIAESTNQAQEAVDQMQG